jgi:alginate O-acetyltransferase complex protein AlgI
MEFSQLYYVFLFLPAFFLCYYLFGKLCGLRGKNITLLIFSLIFYAWGEPMYVLLMGYSTVLDYTCGLGIGRAAEKGSKRKKKAWLAVSLIGNLGLLAVFKYLDLFFGTLNILPFVNLPLAHIALPIGISFYTFQTMSYSIDVYLGKVKPQRDIANFATYVTMFPQLVAGPVVRYSTVEAELSCRTETIDDFAMGLRRFIVGLSKKVLIANTMGAVADSLYNPAVPSAVTTEISHLGSLGAWVVIIAYTMQIYFDFSGYSDMAIGIGRMMGFRFLENFNYPYISKSITEFWRRWHISMSTFFRDYVYIPLGGNRCSRLRWFFNIMTVWFLTGLWHGAQWNFVLWGLYFAVILLCERLFLGKLLERLPVFNHLYAIFLIIYGWVIFRCNNIGEILEFTKTMFGAYGWRGDGMNPSVTLLSMADVGTIQIAVFVIAIIASTPILSSLKAFAARNPKRERILSVAADVALLVLFSLSIVELTLGSYNPFIYFKF